MDEPDVVAAARGLLGRTITGHGVTVRITEVEAYAGPGDPASHAVTRTPRSEIMYGEPWRLYVYRSYGLHHCANVVTGPAGTASAALLRAGAVVAGIDLARERRGAHRPEHHLARGPGNLASALGLHLGDNGTHLLDTGGAVRLGAEAAVSSVSAGPRVGVARAAEVPWRLWVTGDPTVSAYRRSPRAPKPGAPGSTR